MVSKAKHLMRSATEKLGLNGKEWWGKDNNKSKNKVWAPWHSTQRVKRLPVSFSEGDWKGRVDNLGGRSEESGIWKINWKHFRWRIQMLLICQNLKELCGRRCSWNWFTRELKGRIERQVFQGLLLCRGKELWTGS